MNYYNYRYGCPQDMEGIVPDQMDECQQEQQNQQAQIQQQLQVLDDSCKYTSYIIIGILLTQKTLGVQRCQLECQAAGMQVPEANLFPCRLASNLLVLCALSYFNNLSNTISASETQETSPQQRCSNQLNNISSFLVYFASLIRLADLLKGGRTGGFN